MERIAGLPLWIKLLASAGLGGVSMFLPDLEPWQRGLGFSVSIALLVWAAIGTVWHVYRSKPAPASSPAQEANRQAYEAQASNAFKVIGEACGTDTPLGYEMALASIEPMFLLLKQAGIPIPRLRGDGIKLGILRAQRYLHLIHPALHIGNEKEAKRRAEKAVPLINRAKEARLWADVDQHFRPPLPPLPAPSRIERDTRIGEAIAFVHTGLWGGHYAQVVRGLYEGNKPFRVTKFLQAAADGEFIIWGRLSALHVFVPIDREFWIDHHIDHTALVAGRSRTEWKTVGKRDDGVQFEELMVSKAQVEHVFLPKMRQWNEQRQ